MNNGNMLPRIMVAPNGARRSKSDHPKLPITIAELITDAIACKKVGAAAIHAHVRDNSGRHSLDIGLYRELMQEMEVAVPDMLLQLTTESAGIYNPSDQRKILTELDANSVSVAIREFLADNELKSASQVYYHALENGTDIQLILYDRNDIDLLARMVATKIIPSTRLQLLLVMGSYFNCPAKLEDLSPLLSYVERVIPGTDLAICAFGIKETQILSHTLKYGYKIRVGFENNLYNIDGQIASDNASRVDEVFQYTAKLKAKSNQT